MKILIGIGHPAHVHFYKNSITELKERGHSVHIMTKNREMAIRLLDCYNFEYDLAGKATVQNSSTPKMLSSFLKYEYSMIKKVREYQPDIVTGVGTVPLAHASALFNCKSIIFTDSEAATVQNKITIPFADEICTPIGYNEDYGKKHTRYNGYHELSYLHPDRFNPDIRALEQAGVNTNERYFVVRFIAWQAQHDVGHNGLSMEQKQNLISSLSDKGTVYITSESELPEEFEPYRLPVPPHLMHDLLAEANLYVGDSQTMATEAAVLGTPAIRSNSFAGQNDMSNFVELEEKYNLLYSTPDGREAIAKAQELLEQPDLQSLWEQRREVLLENKIDVTEFMTTTILNGNT